MTDRDAVRRTYDAHAAEYAARRTADERELAVLEAFCDDLSSSARVLDAGCGQGDPILQELQRRSWRAVGVDFSQAQLGLAADAVPDAALVAGDLTALPFREGAFDAVAAVDAIIHVPLSEHQTVVDEFARVLRDGGRLLLSEAPQSFERETDDWLGEGAEMSWEMAGADATREQLRSAGFRLTDEWSAPEPVDGEPPKPPFFAVTLDG